MKLKTTVEYFNKNRSHLRRFIETKISSTRYFLPGYKSSFLPKIIYIVLNRHCNLKCKMCDIGTRTLNTSFYDKLVTDKDDFDLEKLKSFIDSIQYFNPLISFTSTEPLLYKGLIDISSYVKKKNMNLSITTNGYLLPKFAEKFVDIGVDNITISLDGQSKVHNEIRGIKDSFEQAILGLKRLEEFKELRKTRYPLVSINYTISEKNYFHLVDFINYMQKYDIVLYSFSHINFVTPEMSEMHNRKFGDIGISRPTCITNVDFQKIDYEELYKQISYIKSKKGDLPILFVPDFSSDKETEEYYINHTKKFGNETCFVPWKYVQILANGDVTVLTRCFDVSFGNVFEERFEDIWNGEKLRLFRDALKKNKYFPACLRCCGLF